MKTLSVVSMVLFLSGCTVLRDPGVQRECLELVCDIVGKQIVKKTGQE